MSKYSVKKPYTVLVAVVLVLVLGFVSFTKMTTDLLPSINLPYLMVVTTYPGASPEKVESSVTAPLESALGTVTGVENVTSTSAENYSMVMLEFEEDTNMDSAMVKVSSAVDQVSGQLPDLAGTPSIMEITPDMMATMYVSASYDGKDIYDLSSFAEDELLPYLERQSGVASVSTVGMVERQVEVRLNQTKIDQVNDKMLVKVSSKLADAKQELDDSYQKLVDSQQDLTDGKNDLLDGQQKLDDGKNELTDGAKKTYQTLVDSGYQLSALVEHQNRCRGRGCQAAAAEGRPAGEYPEAGDLRNCDGAAYPRGHSGHCGSAGGPGHGCRNGGQTGGRLLHRAAARGRYRL